MLSLSFDKLIIAKQHRNKPKSNPVNPISYDTETVHGQCELLADSQGDYIHPNSFEDCLHFLCRRETRGMTGFFYNLGYDWQAILKWTDPEHWLTLHQKNEVVINGFEISYIPKKFLNIKYKKRVWRFFDLAQHFQSKLEVAAQKYLGEGKQVLPERFDMTHVTYDDCHDQEFITYCLKDARLCNRLAHLFIETCQSMGLIGGNFSSQASLSYDYFSRNCKIPTINRFIDKESLYDLLKIPWYTISGAFISVFKRGYFPNCFVYDINSSYPKRISQLPNLDKGSFFTDDEVPSQDYHMGWMHVIITINSTDIGSYHPCIPILRPRASNHYPIGRLDTWITLDEYRLFAKYYYIEVIEGLYWVPDRLEYPFKDHVLKCYNRRKIEPEGMIRHFLKFVLNGLYGKTLQKVKVIDPDDPLYGYYHTGPMFNPFYASYILAQSRLAVFNLLLQIPDDQIIACFTDSVICTQPLDIPLSKELGDWGYDKSGEAVMIGCGVYSIKPTGEQPKTKLRGFRTKNIDLFKKIRQQSDHTYKGKPVIEIDHLKNIRPAIALRENRINDMNLLLNEPKKIAINFDTKRLWHRNWTRVGDILDTPPIDSLPNIEE